MPALWPTPMGLACRVACPASATTPRRCCASWAIRTTTSATCGRRAQSDMTTLTANRALDSLVAHYTDRQASVREALSRGTGVVGRIGNTVPTELVLACGWWPVLVAAEREAPTPTADVYMEPSIAPVTRSLFESLL